MELKRTERTGKEIAVKINKYGKGVESLLKGALEKEGETATATSTGDALPEEVELVMDESVRKKLAGPLRDVSAMLAKYAGSIALCRGKLEVLRGTAGGEGGTGTGTGGDEGEGGDGDHAMTPEDKKRVLAETQAGFARAIAATPTYGGIAPNQYAAAVDVRGTEYILVKVAQFMVTKKTYKVQDADLSNNKTYSVPEASIVGLGFQSFPVNTRVLAMFPETSTFYPATVIGRENGAGTPSGKAYRLIFDDDEEVPGHTPQRIIDAAFVTTFPPSHPEAAASTKQPSKKQRRR
jgi:hypothetical protein